MTVPLLRFNKTNLDALVNAGRSHAVKDTIISGFRFKVGVKRAVFQFGKRISGRKGAPVTSTIGAFPAVSRFPQASSG